MRLLPAGEYPMSITGVERSPEDDTKLVLQLTTFQSLVPFDCSRFVYHTVTEAEAEAIAQVAGCWPLDRFVGLRGNLPLVVIKHERRTMVGRGQVDVAVVRGIF